MDENGETIEVRQRAESFPIALMALPVKPQSTWTLEPEHAQNILGGQVRPWLPAFTSSHAWRPVCTCSMLQCPARCQSSDLEPTRRNGIQYSRIWGNQSSPSTRVIVWVW